MATLYRNFLWQDTKLRQDMLVENGIVISRAETVTPPPNLAFEAVDRSGFRLFPSFVDNHCHILPTGLDLLQLDLSSTESHEEVLEALHARRKTHPDGWLLAVYYDQNRYQGIHLTSGDLDKISKDRPILLKHSSGHAGVANSEALRQAKVAESVSDPSGGAYLRDESGKLNGILLEAAFEHVRNAIPRPSVEQMKDAILAACDSMASMNICSASDMQTGCIDMMSELEAYRLAAEQGAKIAMRLYLQWGRVFGPRAIGQEALSDFVKSFSGSNCRIQGIKLFADGAIGSGTAAIYGAYPGGENQKDGYSGTLMYKPEVLKSRILQAANEGWQVSVHAIGDYAADLVMDAFESTETPSMHRLEHAMILSDEQIGRLSKINCHVCLQPEFLGHFGRTYRMKLGEVRAQNLIRTRSLIDAGLNISFSSDRPITTGKPEVGIQLATARPQEFDSKENCTFLEAMMAYTHNSLKTTSDLSEVGTLEAGKTAGLNWHSNSQNNFSNSKRP